MLNQPTYYYNVLSLQGNLDALERIVQHFIKDHDYRDGYEFNIRGIQTDESHFDDVVVAIRNRYHLDDMMCILESTDVTDALRQDALSDIYKYLYRVAERIQNANETTVDLARHYPNLIAFLEKFKQEGNPTTFTRDELNLIYTELSDVNIKTTNTWFSEPNEELFASIPKEENYTMLINVYTVKDVWFTNNCGFVPATHEELTDYRNGLEDLQSYYLNVLSDEDAILTIGTISKFGPIVEVLEYLTEMYGIEGSLIYGNGIDTGTYVMGEVDGKLNLNKATVEASLNSVTNHLLAIEQLENALHYFKWSYDDVYGELDNDQFIGTMPVGGIE